MNNNKSADAAASQQRLASEAANIAHSHSELTNNRTQELLAERQDSLPVWIRSPKRGTEHFSGLSRAKLYELAASRKIRSVSLRSPGQVKGTRLFLLSSIFEFIEKCENTFNGGEAA